MSLFRKSDYASKKETVHRTKLPTQLKSKPVYCRNCNRQNPERVKICSQCGVPILKPKLRRKMK